MSFRQYRLKNYNFRLVLMVIALSVFGVFAVGSAQSDLQSRQLGGVLFGIAFMIFVSLIDYHIWLKAYWVFYFINVILLLLVNFLGENRGGAQRWLKIGGLQFQPSELAKILLILFFAQYIMKRRENFNSVRVISSCIFLVLIPIALIVNQPDLSTTIIVGIVFCAIMFSGGINLKFVLGVLAIAIPVVVIVVSIALRPDTGILEDYQRARILAFISPEEYSDSEAYQQLNSVTAIASGQLDGKGYKNNLITSVKNGNFLSEDQTDFIFAVIGEEFGFKGSLLIIFLTMGIALECISIGRRASDLSGAIIGASLGCLIGFQSFINIGVATFIMPNTGLPLPFVSYGLTSLLTLFGGIGIVLNVRLQGRWGKAVPEEEFILD